MKRTLLILAIACAAIAVLVGLAAATQQSKILEYFGVNVQMADDKTIIFGDGSDGSIGYDETTDDLLEITCANGIAISGAVSFDSAIGILDDIALTFGTDSDASLMYDETTDDLMEATGDWQFAGKVGFGSGVDFEDDANVADDKVMIFGDNDDGSIGYDETTDDKLEITCSTGVGVSGAMTIDSTLTSSATGSIGWSIVAGANTACNTTCTSACIAGQDADASNVLVACDSANADLCICAGAS